MHMQRDKGLMVRILRYIEQHDSISGEFPEPQELVNEHVKYLLDESYLKGKPIDRGLDKVLVDVLNPRLTKRGHNFLEAGETEG